MTPTDDTIAAVFASDPRELTDASLTVLITELRRRRSVFQSEEAAKALAPKKTRAKPTTNSPLLADKPVSEMTLADLMGDGE